MKADEWSGFTQEFRQRMINVYAKFDHSSIKHAHYTNQGTKILKQRARQRKYIDNLAEVRKKEIISEELWTDTHHLSQLQAAIEGAQHRVEVSQVQFMKDAMSSIEEREKQRCKIAKRRAHKAFARRHKLNAVAMLLCVILFTSGVVVLILKANWIRNVNVELRKAILTSRTLTADDEYCTLAGGQFPDLSKTTLDAPTIVKACDVNGTVDEFRLMLHSIANAYELTTMEGKQPIQREIGPFVFQLVTVWTNITHETVPGFVSYHRQSSYRLISSPIADLVATMTTVLNPGYLSFVKRLKEQNLDEEVVLPLYATSRLFKETSNVTATQLGALPLFYDTSCDYGKLTFGCFVKTHKLETQHVVHGIYGFEEINRVYENNLLQLPVFGQESLTQEQATHFFGSLVPVETYLNTSTQQQPLTASESLILPTRAAHNAKRLYDVFQRLWSRNSQDTILFTSTLSRLDRAKSDGNYDLVYAVLGLEDEFCRDLSSDIVPGGLMCTQVNDLAQYILFLHTTMYAEMEELNQVQGAFVELSLFQVLFQGFGDVIAHQFTHGQRWFWEMIVELESMPKDHFDSKYVVTPPVIYPVVDSDVTHGIAPKFVPSADFIYLDHVLEYMEHSSETSNPSRIGSLFALDRETHSTSLGVSSVIHGFQPYRLGAMLDIRYSGGEMDQNGELMYNEKTPISWPTSIPIWYDSIKRHVTFETAGHFVVPVSREFVDHDEWLRSLQEAAKQPLSLEESRNQIETGDTSSDSVLLLLTKFIVTNSIVEQPTNLQTSKSRSGMVRYPTDIQDTTRCLISMASIVPFKLPILRGIGSSYQALEDGEMLCPVGDVSVDDSDLNPDEASITDSRVVAEIIVEPVTGMTISYLLKESYLTELFPTVNVKIETPVLLAMASTQTLYQVPPNLVKGTATVLELARIAEDAVESNSNILGGLLVFGASVCALFVIFSPKYRDASVTPLRNLEEQVKEEYQNLIGPILESLHSAIEAHEKQESKVMVRKVEIEASMEPSLKVEDGVVVLGISRKGSIYKVGDVDTNISNGAEIRKEIEQRYDDRDDYGFGVEDDGVAVESEKFNASCSARSLAVAPDAMSRSNSAVESCVFPPIDSPAVLPSSVEVNNGQDTTFNPENEAINMSKST